MKYASFYYPSNATYRVLRPLLQKKGYIITAIDESQGIIKAYKQGFLRKRKNLEIQIVKLDKNTTGIRVMINGNERVEEKSLSFESIEEEKLMDSIQSHF